VRGRKADYGGRQGVEMKDIIQAFQKLFPWVAELPLAYLLLSLLVVALVTLFLMLIWVTTERDS
jgi:hypothetical protein